MSTEHLASGDAEKNHGFHGPRSWALSVCVGLALGMVLAYFVPATHAVGGAASDGTAQHAADTRVIETRPDGSRHMRLVDESTRELKDGAVEGSGDAEATGSSPGGHAGMEPPTPLWLCVPFVLLLASIALMPFVNQKFWHHHYPDFALLLGGLVLAYYLMGFGGGAAADPEYGRHAVLHAGLEYYAFIALVGGLYIASGGILVDVRVRGRAATNTALLACGCVLANLVGTTGASVLLIRPFLRMNEGRLRPLHVVFFIFIVSNCAGCLTPIGDPPLYLGYLKGVPFFWTLTHLWPMWLLTCGMLLGMFYVFDRRVPAAAAHVMTAPVVNAGIDARGAVEKRERVFDPQHRTPLIVGWPAVAFLVLIVAAVFIDPALKDVEGFAGLPIGATVQVVLAGLALMTARPSIRHANQFTLEPVKEVAFLFVGIFLTMIPALGYLRANAAGLGLESPTQFYFAAGFLSAFLDNAPTYLSFVQAAFGVLHLPLDAGGFAEFIRNTYDIVHGEGGSGAGVTVHFNGQVLLEAISLGAVFFGAMTYIGNGPNFMVKAIVDAAHAKGEGGSGLGVRMPSFLGYMGWSVVILLPVLVVNWAMFIR